jgi:AraC-like DNA-binding protein
VGDVRREAEGTNFRRILSEVRRGLGLRRMAEGRLAIDEVAFLPGFSEVSAFHRAFQQWTGHAPHAYRVSPHSFVLSFRTVLMWILKDYPVAMLVLFASTLRPVVSNVVFKHVN